jgi:2-C-methyl-D-erythritol 4-phosphate cytidylyltransferase
MIDDLGIIVAAAGSGERYGRRNKLLEPLGELPLFIHCLKRFITLCPAEQLILVVSRHEQHSFSTAIERFMPGAEIVIIEGGNYRAQSIVNGLQQLPKNVNYVAIHDAARPFASVELLERCLAAARQYGAAIPAKPVTDTLKRVDENDLITATICRENLWRVETPQVFNLELLQTAYCLAKDNASGALIEFTDDAAVMAVAGLPVKIVNAPEPNLKITYPEDIATAEIILTHKK